MITQEQLCALMRYDPETGIFSWIKSRPGASLVRRVGSADPTNGYIKIRVMYRPYYAHRLAWLYMTGAWPPDDIDHINRNKTDNRWANLRLATRGQNGVNTKRRRDNTSGFKGINQLPSGRWRAVITLNGKPCHIGTFDTAEEAFSARNALAETIYGEYYRPE